MGSLSPHALAHRILDAAEDLRVRVHGPPADMPRVYRLSVYLDDLARALSGDPLSTYRITYADRRCFDACARILVGTDGYFRFHRGMHVLHAQVCAELRWLALELSFLSQRGYKVDRSAIRTMADYLVCVASLVADSPDLAARVRSDETAR